MRKKISSLSRIYFDIIDCIRYNGIIMANITIRDLPDKTKETLRVHAAQAGISLEAYTRHILQKASRSGKFKPVSILEVADRYFGPKHGIEIELPKRGSKRRPVDFGS